ncbi:MAG: type I restriction-modification system subunit M N-terminal domain-containing protein [Solirubrobacteraceae bacterium]
MILPLIVMRRLDQVMETTRDRVFEEASRMQASGVENPELALRQVAGQQFFNRSRLRIHQLLDDPDNLADHLRSYIDGYWALARQAIALPRDRRECPLLHAIETEVKARRS